MAVYRFTVEYDGTNFAGWQVQPGCRTVQGLLNAGLRQVLQADMAVVGAGRTDAGVHAKGMVAHCRLPDDTAPAPEDLERSLNGVLPEDVRVRDMRRAADDFHARYAARQRAYRYQIATRPRVIGRQYWWEVPFQVDVEKMRAGAARLIGKHDCAVFASGLEPGINPRCHILAADWTENDGGLWLDITADRFLRKMVRGIVGTLVDVGRGKRDPEDITDMLAHGNRDKLGGLAPPHGLCLMNVRYA